MCLLYILVSETLEHLRFFISVSVLCSPQQVHIAFGNSVTEMVIVWSTRGDCSTELKYSTQPFGGSTNLQGNKSTLPGIVDFPYLHKVELTVSFGMVSYNFKQSLMIIPSVALFVLSIYH